MIYYDTEPPITGSKAVLHTSPNKLSRFLLDSKNKEGTKQMRRDFYKTHLRSDGSCLAGALNCNTDYVAPYVDAPAIRAQINDIDRDPTYEIASKAPLDISYKKNKSIDAWEVHRFLRDKGIGTTYYTQNDRDEAQLQDITYNNGVPSDLDVSNIPLGAILGQGDSRGNWTLPKDGKRNRHSFTVVGFDTDGMPMVYDYGNLSRLDNLRVYPIQKNITNVTVPKGYEKYTNKFIKESIAKYKESLGLEKAAPLTIPGSNSKKYLTDIETSANAIKNKLSYEYGIPHTAMSKLAAALPGLASKESKIAGNEGFTRGDIADNLIGNVAGKPILKLIKAGATALSNQFKPDIAKRPVFELEIEAYKKFPDKNSDEFKEEFQRLFDENEGNRESIDLNTDSSVGPYSLKNIPEYSKNELGIKRKMLYGAIMPDNISLQKSTAVALNLLAENYVRLAKKYPDLNEDQLTKLAVVSYNSVSKPKSRDYVDNYIKTDNLDDSYLNKVMNYGKKVEGRKLNLKKALDMQNEIDATQKAAVSTRVAKPYIKNFRKGGILYKPK